MFPVGSLIETLQGRDAPEELAAWGWQNIVDADAGLITLTGLGAVFFGLVGLCLFMMALGAFNRFLERRAQGPVAEEGASVSLPPPSRLSAPAPVPAPAPLSFSLLAAAQLGLHLFTENRLRLGDVASIEVQGRARQVVLLAVGPVNRALVDGEELVFTCWRVAPGDEGGRTGGQDRKS